MKKSYAARFILFGVFTSLLAASIMAQKPSAQRIGMQAFMRQKLTHSQGVLEGIALEKFELVSQNALRMRKMSQTNSWSSMKNVNYMARMADYQKSLDELALAAADKNLEASTEAYMKVARNCVECHRIVRVDQHLKAVQEESKSK